MNLAPLVALILAASCSLAARIHCEEDSGPSDGGLMPAGADEAMREASTFALSARAVVAIRRVYHAEMLGMEGRMRARYIKGKDEALRLLDRLGGAYMQTRRCARVVKLHLIEYLQQGQAYTSDDQGGDGLIGAALAFGPSPVQLTTAISIARSYRDVLFSQQDAYGSIQTAYKLVFEKHPMVPYEHGSLESSIRQSRLGIKAQLDISIRVLSILWSRKRG